MGCGLSKEEAIMFEADIEAVRDAIHLVHDVNIRQPGGGVTPLLHAVQRGWREHAVLFLKHGAFVNLAPKPDGVTPLHAACLSDMPGLAVLMLRRCPNVDVRDEHGRTPLHYAVTKSGATDGRVGACVEAGADPTLLDHDGQSALHLARRPEFVPWLVEAGVDPMGADEHGDAPIHVVVERGDEVEMVTALLGSGCHPDIMDASGATALHTAAARGLVGTVAALLDAGAALEVENKHSATPLLLAAEGGHMAVVGQLLAAGADVDATDDGGDTPLMEALAGEYEDIVRALVGAGADITCTNVKGVTASSAARKAGLSHLLAASANPGPKRMLMTKSMRMASRIGMWSPSRGPAGLAAAIEAGGAAGNSSSSGEAPPRHGGQPSTGRDPLALLSSPHGSGSSGGVAAFAGARATVQPQRTNTRTFRSDSGWLLEVPVSPTGMRGGPPGGEGPPMRTAPPITVRASSGSAGGGAPVWQMSGPVDDDDDSSYDSDLSDLTSVADSER